MSSSYQVERIFVDAIKEVVEQIANDMTRLDDMNEAKYRNMIQEIVMENDEYLKKMFDGVTWATYVDTGGPIPVLHIAKELEDLLKRAMIHFNDENQELIYVFKEWEEKHKNFIMASVYAEEYMSDEEYANYETRFKALLDRFAESLGLTKFRAKMQLPPFDSIIDKVEWLEEKLDGEKAEDIIKDVEIDKDAIDRGEAKENESFVDRGHASF